MALQDLPGVPRPGTWNARLYKIATAKHTTAYAVDRVTAFVREVNQLDPEGATIIPPTPPSIMSEESDTIGGAQPMPSFSRSEG